MNGYFNKSAWSYPTELKISFKKFISFLFKNTLLLAGVNASDNPILYSYFSYVSENQQTVLYVNI